MLVYYGPLGLNFDDVTPYIEMWTTAKNSPFDSVMVISTVDTWYYTYILRTFGFKVNFPVCHW